ncbi:unnamed protein product [Calypogeia fissa]
MVVVRDKKDMRNWSRARKRDGERVALVPTMGSLHEGHLLLVQMAKAQADRVVVSIYVNPGQFAPGEDFSIYPRNFEADLEKLKPFQVDVVFNPYDLYVQDEPADKDDSKSRREGEDANGKKEESVSLVGEDESCTGHETWIRVERLEKHLCGKSRPVFFRGVATVVAKLFNIVEPDVAIFGRKDFQQWRVICNMVRDLDFSIEIIGAPLLREPDGLAMSSRNVRLTSDERQQALVISRSLKEAEALVKGGETNAAKLTELVHNAITAAGGRVDYVEMVEQSSLRPVTVLKAPAVIAVAAHFGSVRLLDNIELQLPS